MKLERIDGFIVAGTVLFFVLSLISWKGPTPSRPPSLHTPKLINYCTITPELMEQFEKTHHLSSEDWDGACSTIPDPLDPFGDVYGK